jgi:hypothetical protein
VTISDLLKTRNLSRRTSRLVFIFFAAASLGGAMRAAEEAGPADKTAYSLFHRTPESQLRELNTDRPDVTESPYTIDAGWLQLEADFVSYTHDRDHQDGNDIKNDAISYTAFNFKLGLTSHIDLQTVVTPYVQLRSHDQQTGAVTRQSGFSDVLSRLKINLWGNDSGDSALGLMPFVKWPINHHGLGNHSFEGGLIVPYARKLSAEWDIGLMTELDVVRNEEDDGYTPEWLNTVTLGHELPLGFGGYVELTSTVRRGAGQATFDVGCTYAVGKNGQLDLGCNLGLTRATDDILIFSGWSIRF